jgi:hypothetical protein
MRATTTSNAVRRRGSKLFKSAGFGHRLKDWNGLHRTAGGNNADVGSAPASPDVGLDWA